MAIDSAGLPGREVLSALSGPTDWILRYIKHSFFNNAFLMMITSISVRIVYVTHQCMDILSYD